MADGGKEVGGRVERNCKPCLNKDIKRSADIFCTNCNAFQCNECYSIHKIFDFMKDHIFLNVSEFGDCLQKVTNDLENIDLNGLDVCKKHKKQFEFYCKDDNVFACVTCAFRDHRNCDGLAEIEDIAVDDNYEMTDCETLVETLQSTRTTLKQSVENLNEAEVCLSDDVQKISDKLSKLRTNILQRFDEFAEKLTKDANSYRDQTTAEWADRKLECETKLKTVERTLDSVDNVAKNGTPAQQFITAHTMTEIIQNDVENVDTLCADLLTLNVSCNFSAQFDTLSSSLISALTPDEFGMEYTVPKKTKLEQLAVIDLKQTDDDVEEPLYLGLDFLPDGRLVAVDSANCKCLLYDEKLVLLSAYKLPYHPLGIVVVSDEEVAITTGVNCRLDFLHVSKSNEITLNRTCKVSVEYYSISMKDEENFVVSTRDHDTRVRMVSISGEEKDFDIEFPSKKYRIGTSTCTYIRGQDKLVLTDKDADTVYIYDVKTGDKVAIKDAQIKAPFGVATGPYDHLFVGSWSDTNSLVEITPTGRVLSSHQVDMENPCTVAVSKDRTRLAVSNAAFGIDKLKLYKILSE